MADAGSVVYFAYLGAEGTDDTLVEARVSYMEAQLDWLAELVGGRHLIVPFVAPRAWDELIVAAVERRGFRIDPSSLGGDRRNTYEYPGFRTLKALAIASDPDAFLYYCHSKGIVHLETNKMGLFRLHTHVGLTIDAGTIAGGIDKAGLFPSRFGWCWYNFFWVRAGYMAARDVAESADRYAFEALIGERGDRDAYRTVLPLVGRLRSADTGVAPHSWYRPEETSPPALFELYDRYARLRSVSDAPVLEPFAAVEPGLAKP